MIMDGIELIFFKILDVLFYSSILYIASGFAIVLFKLYGYLFQDNLDMRLNFTKENMWISLIACGIILSQIIN